MSENKTSETGDNLVQSLQRGLEILRRLAPSDNGLTLNELAAEMGLKQGTIYKLLQTLVVEGFVEKSARPVRYTLGGGAFALAEQYHRRDLLKRAEGVLERLFAAFSDYRANVVLAEALGGEVEIVLRMSPERPGILERPRGRIMAPYTSACPLVFQAFWTERERREYQRRHPFWEEGAHLWETPENFDLMLESIRKQGYAVPQFKSGMPYLLAVPVFTAGAQLAAVLGVSMPVSHIPATVWREQVQMTLAAAKELSAAE